MPIVSEDVGFSVQAEFLQTKGNNYMLDLAQRLIDGDNPCVAKYISQMAVRAKTP